MLYSNDRTFLVLRIHEWQSLEDDWRKIINSFLFPQRIKSRGKFFDLEHYQLLYLEKSSVLALSLADACPLFMVIVNVELFIFFHIEHGFYLTATL